jgi:Transcriptional regulator/sugar kinase
MQGNGVTLAIDVGGSRSRLALVDNGSIGERVERATAELVGLDGTITTGLAALARRLHDSAGLPRLPAIGVGMAAAVDSAGIVLQARDFGIPRGPFIRDALAETFGVPVLVENDANLAALAEHRLGAAQGEANAAVITLGTNIGLGLILGGRIHRGARGAAGEIGLLLVPAADADQQPGEGRLVDAGPLGRTVSRAPAGYAWIEELVGGGALAAAAGEAHPRVFAPAALSDPAIHKLSERAIEGWWPLRTSRSWWIPGLSFSRAGSRPTRRPCSMRSSGEWPSSPAFPWRFDSAHWAPMPSCSGRISWPEPSLTEGRPTPEPGSRLNQQEV